MNSPKISKKLTIQTNKNAKNVIKQAMLDRHTQVSRKRSRFSFLRAISSPRKPVLAGFATFLFVATFLTINLLPTPLKADQVIAGALRALDENQAGGKWQYTKTREEMTYTDRTFVTITETWTDTKFVYPEINANVSDVTMPNSSYKSTLLDGRVLDEYVTYNNESYERDTRTVKKEVYGYDPYEQMALMNSDASIQQGPPGFEEAGLDNSSFETMSMKEIDDALVAAGQQPLNSINYKSLDFPAYTMSPKEINDLYARYDEIIAQTPTYFEDLYGGPDNIQSITYDADGKLLTGDEAKAYNEQLNESFQTQDRLRNGSLEEKRKALEKLQKTANIKMITDVEWDGKPAIAIDLTSANNMQGSTQFIYLDPKTYKMIGEEFTFEPINNESLTPFSMNAMPSRVRVSYLEQFSTDIEPKFSIEGLSKSADLYKDLGINISN